MHNIRWSSSNQASKYTGIPSSNRNREPVLVPHSGLYPDTEKAGQIRSVPLAVITPTPVVQQRSNNTIFTIRCNEYVPAPRERCRQMQPSAHRSDTGLWYPFRRCSGVPRPGCSRRGSETFRSPVRPPSTDDTDSPRYPARLLPCLFPGSPSHRLLPR